jgi:hypothetical protein
MGKTHLPATGRRRNRYRKLADSVAVPELRRHHPDETMLAVGVGQLSGK